MPCLDAALHLCVALPHKGAASRLITPITNREHWTQGRRLLAAVGLLSSVQDHGRAWRIVAPTVVDTGNVGPIALPANTMMATLRMNSSP